MTRGKIHTINLAAPPEVLVVAPGDTIRVITEFDYIGPALSARMISAIWHPTFFDPHDEIVRGNKSFTIPSSPPPGNHITVTMDLLVPSGEVGTDYGLYSSIRDVPGPDIYTGYYPNIITITEEVVPKFKGAISKKELEYNESRGAIPVSNVPQDKEGKVHIWGRNDMATNQKLGIHWIVRDPDGLIVEDYEDWQFGSASPGATHEFISPGRFDLNKPGPWTIAISLSMNPASPLTADSYAGALCTVKAAPPATYHLSIFVPTWAYGGYVTPSSRDYPANTTVKLTAHPFSGYQFLGWGRDASGTSPTYNLLMNSDKNVEAYFEKVAEPPTYYPCPYCGATFTTMDALTSHIEEMQGIGPHPPAPPVYYCPYCSATFSSQAALDAHIATAHPPPVHCKVGDWKCVGRDLYICIEWGTINRWKLIEKDSNVCYP